MIAQTPQVLTIVNEAGVSPLEIREAESAVERQVQIAGRWWNIPTIEFGPGGWPVTLARTHTDGEQGDHGFSITPEATIDVSRGEWTVTLSHEVLEMLEDPLAVGAPEICDPVEGQTFRYQFDGVLVSDFVLPAYYEHPRPRHTPLDYRHKLRSFLRWWNS